MLMHNTSAEEQNRPSLKDPSPLELLEFGFSIIPVRAYQKEPAVPWKKFQSVRASVYKMTSWEGRGFNWGAVTGKISGFIAVDLDLEAANRLDEFLPTGVPTPIVRTPRGFHIYYKHLGEGYTIPNRSLKALSIDVRGDGGFVVIPPSKNFNGQSWQWQVSPLEAPPAPIPENLWDLLQ